MIARLLEVLPLLTVAIMTIVGMDLRFVDFRRVRDYPILVPVAVLTQWALSVVLVGVAGRAVGLPAAVVGGALLVAAAPVATLSAYYAQLAAGHLALAVTVMAVSNAAAPLLTPLVASLAFRWLLGTEAQFALPLGRLALQSLVGILLPLVAGMLVRHFAPSWTRRWHARLQVLGFAAVALLVGLVLADQFAAVRARFALFAGSSAAFTIALAAAGLLAGKLGARSGDDRRALIWGFPARNVAVAALVATATAESVEIATFIAVLFATQIALLVPFALWLRWRAA